MRPTPGAALPTHVLFNGGVFKATALQQRLLDVLGSWTEGSRVPQLLAGEHDLDHSVARGAAHYGWTKERGGVRIRGGVARSYYIGVETAGLAIPGAPRPLRALCVVPFGMEEGTQVDVPSSDIGLVLGEPAHFRFFSSAVRKADQPGTLLDRLDGTGAGGNRLPRGGSAGRRIGRRTVCSGPLPVAHHGTRHVRTVVRQHAKRRPLETRVQRARGSDLSAT